jgi:hypothetical protein
MPQFTSTEQFKLAQLANLKDLTNVNKIFRKAAIESADAVQSRIQQKGLKSNGTALPPYDTGKTIGAGSPISLRFGEIASKKRIKARMKSHGDTSEFYGYADFRKALGRQTNFMDFTLSGDLWKSWKVDLSRDGAFVGFNSTEQGDIAEYLETRFGDCFILSEQEFKQAMETINIQILKILNK